MKVGIDSSLSMFAQAPGAPAGLTVIEDAKAWLGRYPDFVVRPTGTGGGAATPLTTDECQKLHVLGIGIKTYYNDSPLNSGKVVGSYELGQQDAQNALAQLRAIGVWTGEYPCADIESSNNLPAPNNLPVQVNGDWVRGWCDTIRASEFGGAGMCYGNLGTGSNLGTAILDALKVDSNGNVHRLFLWDAAWRFRQGLSYQNAATQAWNPQAPSMDTIGMVKLWQMSGNDFNGICDENICQEDFYASGIWLPGSVSVPVTASSGSTQPQNSIAQAKALIQQGLQLLP